MVENTALNLALGAALTYGFLISIIIFIITILIISKNTKNSFNLLNILSNPNGSASLTRIFQFAAGVTGTWVIIKYTIAGTLGVEMFATYLAAMGISEGFTKYLQSKKDSTQ